MAALLATGAEIVGALERDPIFLRHFAKKQNAYFASLGMVAQPIASEACRQGSILCSEDTFAANVPSNAIFDQYLERNVQNLSDLNRFVSRAQKHGFDFIFQQWGYQLIQKNEHGEQIIWGVDSEMRKTIARLEAAGELSRRGPNPTSSVHQIMAGQQGGPELEFDLGGLKSVLPGVWRGWHEYKGRQIPTRFEFRKNILGKISGSYSYDREVDGKGEKVRRTGSTSYVTISDRTVEFQWAESDSAGGFGHFRLTAGRLIGAWRNRNTSKENESEWEFVKR